jgi:predicted small metal-binding protein
MKKLKCRDVGFDCNGEIEAATEEEVLNMATAHALQVHQVDITPEMAEQIKPLITEVN